MLSISEEIKVDGDTVTVEIDDDVVCVTFLIADEKRYMNSPHEEFKQIIALYDVYEKTNAFYQEKIGAGNE